MKQPNINVRMAAKAADVPLWQIAASYGVSEVTLIRWLRVPFTQEREKEFLTRIEELSETR
jgi:hypothetical protein